MTRDAVRFVFIRPFFKHRLTKFYLLSPTAVQKGRISTSQPDPANSLQMGLGDMRNPQSFYSSYITLLLRADTIARYQQSLGIPANIAGLETASELGARLLVSIVEWAKNIPFVSEFTLPDQSILLRSCWSELFILSAAQHCSPFHMAQPLTISALTPPSSTDLLAVSSNGPMAFDSAENLRLFEEQVEKLKNLHIDSAEFCCLKAIILFNPGEYGYIFLFIFPGYYTFSDQSYSFSRHYLLGIGSEITIQIKNELFEF